MRVETYNIWAIILQLLTAAGLIYFAWRQTQINRRMQELADFVAISISPAGGFQLQVENVGRVNLYIHKWEVGSMSETFVKPLLIPIDAKSKILITIQPPQIGQHLAKFYLTDEMGSRYLASGEVAIEPVAFQLPQTTTPPQNQNDGSNQTSGAQTMSVSVQLRMRAWSYKTERYEWTI